MNATELLAALEAATGPSGELDRLIADVLGWHFVSPASPHVADYWLLPNGDEASSLPEWTASLDAALTLFSDAGDIMNALDGALEIVSMQGYKVDDTAALQWEIRRHVLIAAIRARGEG